MNRCSLRVTPKEQEGRAEEHSPFLQNLLEKYF